QLRPHAAGNQVVALSIGAQHVRRSPGETWTRCRPFRRVDEVFYAKPPAVSAAEQVVQVPSWFPRGCDGRLGPAPVTRSWRARDELVVAEPFAGQRRRRRRELPKLPGLLERVGQPEERGLAERHS